MTLLDYIPLRIASTGSNFDAEIAGNIPETNPITAANPVPKQMLKKLNTNSKSSALVSTSAINHTNTIPINPPMTHRITASKRN